jgi:hypothetical protein
LLDWWDVWRSSVPAQMLKAARRLLREHVRLICPYASGIHAKDNKSSFFSYTPNIKSIT